MEIIFFSSDLYLTYQFKCKGLYNPIYLDNMGMVREMIVTYLELAIINKLALFL